MKNVKLSVRQGVTWRCLKNPILALRNSQKAHIVD